MQDKTDATPQRNSSQPEGSLPFFTRFLEGQHDAERSAATLKYPSDLDEFVTMKYPSDDDESGDDRASGNASFAGGAGSAQTLKYPSDRDEWEPFLDS